MQLVFIFKNLNTKSNELVVFHKSRHTIIANKFGSTSIFYHNLDSLDNSSIIDNYITGAYIKNLNEENLKSVYSFNDSKLLIVDSLGLYHFKTVNPEYILLTNSPKLNLNRLIDSLQPKTIIADGSNFKSYINRWKATCIKRNIPFHYTGEKGAFIFK